MIIQSQFRPAFGLQNPHLQTIAPRWYRKMLVGNYQRQRLMLEDGDFVELAWINLPDTDTTVPIVVIFHGLEGSIESGYASGMMQALQQAGVHPLLMHFRGCGESLNDTARSYHSGDTGDAKALLQYLAKFYPNAPLAAIGFSLGGNMLLKLQAELGANSPIRAAVSVCAPLELDRCADHISKGFSRLYELHLIQSLRAKLLKKSQIHDLTNLLDLSAERISKLTTFWEFDDAYTAPVHGFSSAKHYYQVSSARQYLAKIAKPTLIIQSIDDPFMPSSVIPSESELSDSTTLEVSLFGGHVGFVAGTAFAPVFWLEQRIPVWLSSQGIVAT